MSKLSNYIFQINYYLYLQIYKYNTLISHCIIISLKRYICCYEISYYVLEIMEETSFLKSLYWLTVAYRMESNLQGKHIRTPVIWTLPESLFTPPSSIPSLWLYLSKIPGFCNSMNTLSTPTSLCSGCSLCLPSFHPPTIFMHFDYSIPRA